MKFSLLFDRFSRRNKEIEPFVYQIPKTLRVKVFHYCQDVFSNSHSYWGGDNQTHVFWQEIHEALLRQHGRFQLVGGNSPAEDAVNFLLNCRDEEFLDFIELILKVDCLFRVNIDENQIVSEINELFISESIGYELTNMIKEEVVEPINDYMFRGRGGKVIKTIEYPRIIRKDNEVVHSMVTKPALQLLSNPKYKTANQEYLEALEDYKKDDNRD